MPSDSNAIQWRLKASLVYVPAADAAARLGRAYALLLKSAASGAALNEAGLGPGLPERAVGLEAQRPTRGPIEGQPPPEVAAERNLNGIF